MVKNVFFINFIAKGLKLFQFSYGLHYSLKNLYNVTNFFKTDKKQICFNLRITYYF